MVGGVLGSGAITKAVGNVSQVVYKEIFVNSALWLQNVSGATFKANLNVDLPIPLYGFVYERVSDLELLKYEYSKSPYLNKSQIATSYIKENTNIAITAYKTINSLNTMPTQIIINNTLIPLLTYYVNQGGLFALATPYGIIFNLALKSLRGVDMDSENGAYGCGLRFEFERLNIANSGESKIKESLDKTQQGIL